MFISLDYQLRPDELARGIRTVFGRGSRINITVTVLAGLALALLIAGDLQGSPRPGLTGGVAAYFLWMLGCTFVYYPWRRRRRARKRRIRTTRATFTEAGISWHSVTESSEDRSDVAWSGYVRIRETAEFFILYTGRKSAVVVPKRAFSPDDAALFSRFVEQEFPQARLAPRAAPAPRG